jgi:PBSX family phage terminase large subunit
MRDFKKTPAQAKATKSVVSSLASNICLEGGSRAGKSFEIMRQIIIRASKAPDSEHLICRETFNACKRSIWQKTMPDVFRICFPNLYPKFNNSDYYVKLANNAKIWIAGLDDGQKLERLLGTEYSTLWFNESNQIPYPAVSKLKTRLAQKNSLVKKCYYDLNPTKTTSWVYQVFHQKINPTDGETLSDPENYLVIKMNPQDNLENLDPEYIKMLEALPEKERLRFLQGEYDNENTGAAVYAFSDDHVSEEAKKLSGTVYCGVDFNIANNADVLISQHAHGIYVWDEQLIAGDTFKKADGLKKKGATGAIVICDSTGKARRTSGMSDHEILKQNGFNVVYKTNPAIKDKIANLNRAFTLGLIKIHPRCKKLLRDLKQLEWKADGLKLDSGSDDSLGHLTDCLAYAVWYLYPLQDFSKYKITSQGRF